MMFIQNCLPQPIEPHFAQRGPNMDSGNHLVLLPSAQPHRVFCRVEPLVKIGCELRILRVKDHPLLTVRRSSSEPLGHVFARLPVDIAFLVSGYVLTDLKAILSLVD